MSDLRSGAATRGNFLYRTALAGAALATGGLAAPTVSSAAGLPSSIAGTLTLGVIGPFTGTDARLGNQMQNGAQQAIDEANRFRSTFDRQYNLRTFDDEDALATGVSYAQFAVDDASIVCMIGHLKGRITESALDTYSHASMPVIVPVSTFDRLSERGYTNFVRLTTRDSIEGRLTAREVVRAQSPKSVIAVTIDSDYGPDVTNGFLRELQSAKVAGSVSVLPLEKPDFVRTAAAVVASKPDVVFLAGTTAEIGPMLGALRDAGFAGPMYASQGFFDPTTVATYRVPAEGLIASTSMPPLTIAPSIRRIKTDFEEKFGLLTPLAAFSYAAAQIAIVASKATGAIDRAPLLNALKRPNTTYSTIVGDFNFTTAGEPEDPNVYFYQVSNGAWKYRRAAHPSGFIIE